MPGLDPGIHLQKKMDCRVKPGNDAPGKQRLLCCTSTGVN
jgi:hypothetical protein